MMSIFIEGVPLLRIWGRKLKFGLGTYIDLKEQQYRHILEFEVQSFWFDSNRPFRIEELVSYWLDLYSIQSEQ